MMSILGLAAAAGSLLLDGVADKVVTTTVDKGSESLKARIGLARDPFKVAFDTALHKAVTDTFTQHPDYDGALFDATFLKSDSGVTLLARMLTPDATLTGAELAAAWADRSSTSPSGFIPANRDDLLRWMTPVCDTFVARLRHYLRADRALLAIIQAQDTAAIHRELENLNTELPRLIQEQADSLAALNSSLLSLSQVLAPLLKEIHATLTRGILPPSSQDDTGVQNFLLHYLGWDTQKVPFGGREQDFNQLDAWFYNLHAPQFLLMTAEAGKGKSALLAQWCALMLQRHDDVDVVFMPISIRFNTSSREVFFSTLGARLAAVHHDQSRYQQIRGEDWHKVCNEYLKRELPEGRHLLVVIDAIDEATGWEVNAGFVPLQLPRGVKLVVSAREQAGQNWRQQLGWDSATVAAERKVGDLSIGGVRAVLNMMGNPLDRLAADGDVVKELYDLTRGDPLLVRLYVDALVGQKDRLPYLKASDLKSIKPGLKGYFDRWWQEQKRQWKAAGHNPLEQQEQVEEFFVAVATARGPLHKEDVLAVTEEISDFRLEDIAVEVGRFIIGDGEQRGYAFSHPRLGYYFSERLSKAKQQAWNQRFVAHGQQFVSDIRQSCRTRWMQEEITRHGYIVQYYATHLQQANATHEQFYELLCHEWAQAWEALRGTYDGFLGDVDLVSKRAEGDSNRILAMSIQVKCALARSSVIGLSSNISPDLLVTATHFGMFSQTQAIVLLRQYSDGMNQLKAIKLFIERFAKDQDFLERLVDSARYMEDDWNRARALVALAPHLPPHEQEFVLHDALVIVQQMKEDRIGRRTQLLCDLAPYMPQVVLEIARNLQNDRSRAEIFVALAPYLQPQQQTNVLYEALLWTQDIEGDWRHVQLLVALAPHMPQAVLEMVQSIEIDWERAEVLVALAPYLPPREQADVLHEALLISQGIKDDWRRTRVLVALAPYLPRAVLEMVQSIEIDWRQADVLVALAPHLPRAVLEIAKSIKDEHNRAEVLVALVPYVPPKQQENFLDEALLLARRLEENGQVEVLISLAPHLPSQTQAETLQKALLLFRHVGMPNRAQIVMNLVSSLSIEAQEAFLQEALLLTRQMEDSWSRAKILTILAPYLPQPVLEISRNIEESWRVQVLVALAPHLPQSVLEMVQSIKKDWRQAEVLVALAPHLSATVLESTRQMEDSWSRAKVLVALIPYLDTQTQSDIVQEMLQMAQGMKDWVRAEVLIPLSLYLPVQEQAPILQEALICAQALDEDWRRADVLIALAPYLPENVFETAQRMKDETKRAEVLVALAPHLPEAVLEITQHIVDDLLGNRMDVLLALAPYLPQRVFEDARSTQFYILGQRAELLSALSPHLAKFMSLTNHTDINIWHITINILSRQHRHEFLLNLAALMPFTLAFTDDTSVPAPNPSITNTMLTQLRRFLHRPYVDLPTVEARRNFLTDAGLSDLEPHLTLQGDQDTFVHALVRLVQDRNRTIDLIRYLRDNITGHADLQAWAADILSTTPLTPRQELAQGILEAVQEVCFWWP